MSYRKKHGNDLLEDYFLNLNEFIKMEPFLLNAVSDRNADAFFLWFEKMALCDRRTLVRFLDKNRVPLPAKYRLAILYRLKNCKSVDKIATLRVWEEGVV